MILYPPLSLPAGWLGGTFRLTAEVEAAVEAFGWRYKTSVNSKTLANDLPPSTRRAKRVNFTTVYFMLWRKESRVIFQKVGIFKK